MNEDRYQIINTSNHYVSPYLWRVWDRVEHTVLAEFVSIKYAKLFVEALKPPRFEVLKSKDRIALPWMVFDTLHDRVIALLEHKVSADQHAERLNASTTAS